VRREVREVVLWSIWAEGGQRRRNDDGHGASTAGHGGGACALRSESKRRQAGGEWRVASEQRRLGHPHLGHRGRGGTWRWRGRAASMQGHIDILSNTWCA
jgi:hypothetical protein